MSRWLFVLFLGFAFLAHSQSEMKTTQGFLFTPHYAYHTPGGDMKKRFDNFSSIGLGIDYKTSSGFTFGIDYDWFFGRSVKDSGIFSQISGPSGFIIDNNGDFSVINLHIKGNYLNANVGYLINLPKDEPNSGILLSAGAGFMQHRIDIIASEVTIPQLNGEYEKGYDQLTYGFATKQFVGYQYLVDKNRYHFRVGLEFNQGFTKGRRTWDFNANKSALGKRLDTTTAFKIGIIVPVYTKAKDDEEFFID